ncbi:glycosyltransferase family 2 protein [Serratia sp. CY49633]|uniref:glycosyltransferase family 2 protein n=1 Tax=Serratia TaxID=613 RepID=UPI0009A8D8AB|nr:MULTISPECIES: glycosyltransferase family 2 protein [Serratia]AVD65290.1 glycosyl transferase family 2 [Serratia marcescens]ELH4210167.1 glycosyltransferase [Serratia marcescens]ELL0334968.1 glycosyltransferase [Serratia marcescens]MBH2552282.1 glycosyltransferase [Serratia marcescens]MBH2571697.1 glycosyltransferase [Serratia marcescens]
MTPEKVLLSIVIAAHNSENYVRQTLHSLIAALDTALARCEIILVNDASTDSTGAIFADFAQSVPQARYYEVEYKNIGKVRNFAIAHCLGRYVTMLDSDDVLKKGSIESIIDFLEKNSPDLLLTKLHEVHHLADVDKTWKGLQPEKLSTDEAISRFLRHKDFQAHLIGQFIKRNLLLDSPIPDFNCYEDFYIFPDLLTHSRKIIFSRESHYLYIKHSSSLSNTPSAEKINNLFVCTEKMDEVFGSKFHDQVLCHWLDIYLKQKEWIVNPEQLDTLHKKVKETHRIGFLMNSVVRFSYKRKAVKTLWKN